MAKDDGVPRVAREPNAATAAYGSRRRRDQSFNALEVLSFDYKAGALLYDEDLQNKIELLCEDAEATRMFVERMIEAGDVALLVSIQDRCVNAVGLLKFRVDQNDADKNGIHQSIRMMGVGLLVFGATAGVVALGLWSSIIMVIGCGVTLAGSAEIERACRRSAELSYRRENLLHLKSLIKDAVEKSAARARGSA